MKKIVSIHKINPRIDESVVLRLVRQFLDECDPEDIVVITMEINYK